MAGDALFPTVALLISGEGTPDSPTIVDSSSFSRTLTVVGDTKYSSTQARFGGTSVAFDGAGDYLAVSASAFALGTGDFTIEAWVRLASYSYSGFFSSVSVSSGNGLSLGTENDGRISFLTGNASGVATSSGVVSPAAIPLNTWVHVAGVRQGSTNTLYIGGVSVGTHTSARNIDQTEAVVGRYYRDQAANYLNGFINALRLTPSARYTAEFTPPNAPLPAYAGQISGTITDDAGAGAARTVRAYRRDTGALVAAANSASNGSYVLNCPTLGQHTLVFLDDDAGTAYNALVLDRVVPV